MACSFILSNAETYFLSRNGRLFIGYIFCQVLKESDIKTSTNDPLPALVVKENIDTLLPHICDLVNLSLSSGSIDGAKLAHLTPLIKGQSLDSSKLKNYRPISNLSFIGKLIERIVLKRLNVHLDANKLNISNQSAYKKLHSCEILMVRIVNDLLIASDEEKATVVMLLDLSAAFDTVDHTKLLSILKHEIRLEGNAFNDPIKSLVHYKVSYKRLVVTYRANKSDSNSRTFVKNFNLNYIQKNPGWFMPQMQRLDTDGDSV